MNSCIRCGKKLETGYPYCMNCIKPGEGPVMTIRNIAGDHSQIINIPVKENRPTKQVEP